MNKNQYVLEISSDGSNWHKVTIFEEGQESRWPTEPFNADIAVREAEAFKHAWYHKIWRGSKTVVNYVRIIIEV